MRAQQAVLWGIQEFQHQDKHRRLRMWRRRRKMEEEAAGRKDLPKARFREQNT